jgi:hypothetical protein
MAGITHINICVLFTRDNYEMYFRVSRDLNLSKLMTACSQRLGMRENSLCFRINNNDVEDLSLTLRDYGIGENGIIEIYLI